MLRRIAVLTAALFAFGLACATGAAAEDLPTPPSLEPAVQFWTRVYTEVDSHSGLIHDSENLAVIYETVHLPGDLSYRARERRSEQAKDRIRSILHGLAKGKRTGLSTDEARVLAQWPSNVTDATLRKAAANLRFQLGLADRFRAGLVRSGKWRPHVEKALRARGVPVQLVALPHVESSYNPKAYSRVGAAGMWQFMRSTGRLYMRIDNVVDERLDPYVSSEGAARLLARNRELTGTWPLAITAYNHGVGGMQRAARTLGTTDMGEIARRYRSRSFGFASRNFYASFLAASRIDREPARYFGAITLDSPTSFTEIELPWFTPAQTLARVLGVELGVLQEHNPALRPAVWSGSKHIPSQYALRVPAGTLQRPVDELLAAVPESARLAEQDRDRFHKVGRGETLSRIARRYGVRESELASLNNLRSRNRLSVGQVLVLPDGAAGGRVARAVVEVAQVSADEGALASAPDGGVYRVRRGDTLSSIADRYGTTERALATHNGIRNRHRLSVGQPLRVPGEAPAPTVIASAEPAPAEVVTPPPAPAPVETAVAPPPVETASAVAPPPAPIPAEPAPAPPDATPARPVPTAAVPPVVPAPRAAPAPIPSPTPTAARAPTPSPAPTTEVEPTRAPPMAPAPEEPPPAANDDGPSQPDPSDYAVHDGNRVTVQAAETLGHYAEWLEVRANDLRKLNRMRFSKPVVIGQRLKLDFARISPAEFEQRRLEYHQSLQNEFFDAFTVTGTEQHVLAPGESLWYLAERKYRVPVWLLRQYNPDLDFAALPAGAPLVVPVVEPRQT